MQKNVLYAKNEVSLIKSLKFTDFKLNFILFLNFRFKREYVLNKIFYKIKSRILTFYILIFLFLYYIIYNIIIK